MEITDVGTVGGSMVRAAMDDILRERLRPAHGQLCIPDRPRIGLVLDPEAVERFAVR